MAHLALFRKYRSQSFDQLSGQDHVTVTLRNALRMRRPGQAYMFCGPRGTGKTSTARIFAKALNCVGADPANPLREPPEQPCNVCALCEHITAGTCLDVNEMDAASNTGVENIREAVIGKVDFAPVEGRRKVYIIDEVHKLSAAAFAALLKTLEEPPPHLVFILATTDPHEVPATIVSRCQRFDFRRIGQRDILERVQWICEREQLSADADALAMIAEAADGSLRDALVILEQAAAFANGRITPEMMTALLGVTDKAALFRLAGHLLAGETAEALQLLDGLILDGRDLVGLSRDLLGHIRALLVTRVARQAAAILKVSDEQFARLHEQASRFEVADLMRAARVMMDLETELKDPVHARLNWEIAMIRLAAEAGAFPRSASATPPVATVPAPTPPPVATSVPAPTPPPVATSVPAPTPPPAATTVPASPPPPGARAGPVSAQSIAVAPPSAPAPSHSPSMQPAVAGSPLPAPPPSSVSASPATRQSAPPVPPPPAGAVTLEAFRAAWPQVLEGLKRDKQMPMYGVLIECKPLTVEGDNCILGVASKLNFHLQQVTQKRADISARLSAVMRCAVRVDVRPHDGPAVPEGAAPAPSEMSSSDPARSHDDFVQESLNLFGGTIV